MSDYLSHRLVGKELHEVESHLIDCSFCSEALEGIKKIKAESRILSISDDLRKLARKRKLVKRKIFSQLDLITLFTLIFLILFLIAIAVIMFICNHCPFVMHIRSEFAKFAREYQAKGIAIVAINSNDVAAFPDDAPDKMKAEAESVGYSFPYLFDESQAVAKAYRAACTPDLFPDLMAAAINRQDIGQWAAAREIVTARGRA